MTDQTNTGGPAFPFVLGNVGRNNHFIKYEPGIDIRDYFAAKAMQGICADRSHSDLKGHAIASAKVAYIIADAMLAERSKK